MRVDFRRMNKVVGINRRNRDVIYRHNPRQFFPLVDDKIKTKEILREIGVPFSETILVAANFMAIEPAIKTLRSHPAFVIKPARGRGGGGVVLVNRDPDGVWKSPSGRVIEAEEVRRHMGDILFGVYSFGRMDDVALVETKIEPHQLFTQIYPRGIPDIRIITYENRPIMAMLRIPTDRSEGRANLHQGAVGVPIDLATGRTGDGPPHPDTGHVLAGIALPYWDEMIDYSIRASRAIPLGYLGVDLVIDRERGPLILELNARPGLQIQVVNRTGLAPLILGEEHS